MPKKKKKKAAKPKEEVKELEVDAPIAEPEATPPPEVQPDPPAPAKEVGGKDSVMVYFGDNQREYSKKVHGAGYKDLAKQFAEKRKSEFNEKVKLV